MSFVFYSVYATKEIFSLKKIDIIFATSTPLTVAIPAIIAKIFRKIPYVFEVRDLWPDFPIQMNIIRSKFVQKMLFLLEYISYRCATGLVALAPGTKNEIIRKSSRNPADVIMIPNGCDTEYLSNMGRVARKEIAIPNEKVVFAYAGTHGKANGLIAVVNSAEVLQQRGNTDIHFLLMGEGREKKSLQELAGSKNLSNITFSGLYDKTKYNEILSEIDIGMQILMNVEAFYYGSSPNKFFDYLAAGKPVLVNYPGWMSELVTEHGCGISVVPDNPEAFADGAELLASHKNEFQKMGANARSLAEKEFAQSKILPRLVEFVESKSKPA